MKKKSPLYNDEIDLYALFKIIWDGKIWILLITIISFLVGFVYNSQIPIHYSNSLTIKPRKTTEFIKLDYVQKLLESNELNESNVSNETNQFYLARFINELEDHEEFITVIKNTIKDQEDSSTLTTEDEEERIMYKYVKLLGIVAPKENEQKYIINFKWDKTEEAKKILQDTLNLVTKNLKERINLELEKILEIKKKLILNNDRIRLDYLKEQSEIARELNILNNQIDNVNLTESSVSLSINTADIAYYLRGYKAIDKEIQLIENRDYQNLKFIQQELNSFKTENIKFADFNVNLISTQTLQDTKLNLKILILLGLIVGIFFVLISNAFQLKK